MAKLKQTKAVVLYKTGQPLIFKMLSIPELKSGQVLVKMAYSGICHSQLLEIQGKRGPDKFLPHTLGHEGSGIVLETGPNVTKVHPGDHVVLSWIKGTGIDVPSVIYECSGEYVNSGAISTLMRQTITSENRLTVIPVEMPFPEAALLGCAIPTGAGTIFNDAKVYPGSSVAIFGIGGVGLSSLLAAVIMNATTIIAIDINDVKLKKARILGATHTINAQFQNPVEQILKITNRLGVNFAIEAAGRRKTMEAAFVSVKDNGGMCVLAGNLPYGEEFSINPMDLIQGKRIIGSWGGGTEPDRDIPLFINLYLAGKLRLASMITHIYKFKDINRSFEDLQNGDVGRALICCNEI